MLRSLLLLTFLLICVPEAWCLAAVPLEYEVYAKDTDHFDTAQFRLWIPEGHPKLSGILVLLPGSDAYALQLCDDPKWQKIASDWNFGLLAVYLTSSFDVQLSYGSNPESELAFIEAVNYFSHQSGHPELAESPLAIVGHSQGGQFAYHFAVRHPEHVLAFVPIKGGYYFLDPTPAAREVPALWFAGEKDTAFRIKNITRLFDSSRALGAPWAFVLDPDAGHEVGRTLQLIIPYLHGMIDQRIGTDGELVPIDESKGYLGDFSTKRAVPYAQFKGDAKKAAWLPDAASAKAWEALVNNKLKDNSFWPTLATASPPHYASIDSPQFDLGDVPVDGPIQTAQIKLTSAANAPPWDEAFCPDSYSYLKVTSKKVDAKTWEFDVLPDPRNLPLGPFKTTIHLRLKEKGQILLGGQDVPVLGRVTGNIDIVPKTLYVGLIVPNETKTIDLDLKSTDGKPLKFLSLSNSSPHPELIQVKPSDGTGTDLRFKCTVTGQKDVGSISGKLLFKLQGGDGHDVSVPFIAQVQDQDKEISQPAR